jgi:hypothetical protein
MHDNLQDKCNKIGCSINDYIVGCIELMVDGQTEFDFGDEGEENRPYCVVSLEIDSTCGRCGAKVHAKMNPTTKTNIL